MAAARRPATEAEVRAISNPVRLRIVRLTTDESLTNRQLAERLDRDPASVLRHVRMLVDQGFLAAEPTRRGNRGAREIPYRSTGKSWQLDYEAFAPDRLSNASLEAFLAEAAASGSPLEGMIRVALWLTDDEREEFSHRLLGLIEEFTELPKRPDARHWSLLVLAHEQ